MSTPFFNLYTPLGKHGVWEQTSPPKHREPHLRKDLAGPNTDHEEKNGLERPKKEHRLRSTGPLCRKQTYALRFFHCFEAEQRGVICRVQ